jgi:hypothetical protein
MPVFASMPVIEPVAVADVEALLAAIAPDRELHEPGGKAAMARRRAGRPGVAERSFA